MSSLAPVPMNLQPLTDTPLVSVVVANYNYARYIGEAIESLQSQTYANFEAIICDDGSSDDSCSVVERYAAADPRIRLIRKSNGGQASALNAALAESHGELVCILDADDTFDPVKIQVVVTTFLNNAQSGIVCHDLILIDGEGRQTGVSRSAQEGFLGPEIPTLRLGLPMPQASGLSFRREVLNEVFPLPESSLRSGADWAIAYAAAYITNTSRVSKTLARYRLHGANLSGATSAANELSENSIAKILSGMTRVLAFTDEFVRSRFNIPVIASRVRNVLEHRLMLAFLQKNSEQAASAAADLRAAFQRVRRDYPASRYLFWQTLSRMPPSLAKTCLQVAFGAFRLRRSLLGARVPL